MNFLGLIHTPCGFSNSTNYQCEVPFPIECKDDTIIRGHHCTQIWDITYKNSSYWKDGLHFEGKELIGYDNNYSDSVLDLRKYDVTSLRENCFKDNATLKKLILKDGIWLKDQCFSDCPNLDTVILANNIGCHGKFNYLSLPVAFYNNKHIVYTLPMGTKYKKKNGIIYNSDGNAELMSYECIVKYKAYSDTTKKDSNRVVIIGKGIALDRVYLSNEDSYSGITVGAWEKTDFIINKEILAKNDFILYRNFAASVDYIDGMVVFPFDKLSNIDFLSNFYSRRRIVVDGNIKVDSVLYFNTSIKALKNFDKFRNVPDSIRTNISVFVPYGTTIQDLSHLQGFKRVKKLNVYDSFKYTAIGMLINSKGFFSAHLVLLCVFIIMLLICFVFLFLLHYNVYQHKHMIICLIVSFLLTCLALFIWTASYWTCWTIFNKRSETASLVYSVISLIIVFIIMRDILKKKSNIFPFITRT